MPGTRLENAGDHWKGSFAAMASPCELLVEPVLTAEAGRLLHLASREAWRIEQKFSRYRDDSVVGRIHRERGSWIEVDDETADLLDFADACWNLSGGLFDITSGVLRRVWKFDGSDRIPSPEQVEALLPLIGWTKADWKRPKLRLPEGMEIDFGGIGKEYAVDRTAGILREETRAEFLLNFGGDLVVTGPRAGDRPWQVGIESPDSANEAVRRIEIRRGGLATSGDSRRYLLKDGVRYSHVLNPFTGWPVRDAPRSVTVLADRCTEAGMIATFALLQGPDAEAFLKEQKVRSWCLR